VVLTRLFWSALHVVTPIFNFYKGAFNMASKVKKAGRPRGTGKYGCDTKVVRVPVHLVSVIEDFITKKLKQHKDG
jgi:hypothetical protein